MTQQHQEQQQHETHYHVLGVQRHASAEELKTAYQRLVLTLHPDKAGEHSQERFQLLQQAWQTLREPQSRALYDHELSQAELRATVVLHDEIDLQDMDCADTNSNCSCGDQHEAQEHGENLGAGTEQAGGNMSSQLQQYTYPCRCGDSYVLAAPDMQLAAHTRQIIIPCRSCSNHILVKLPP